MSNSYDQYLSSSIWLPQATAHLVARC